jgi:Ca2+-binding EF-hand superfamily protein
LGKQNFTPETLHSYLDENGDGQVDKKEFVSRLGEAINVQGLINADLGLVFDTLDRNGDGSISLNEFKTFIKGSLKSREKRIAEIDDSIKRQIRDEVAELFEHFDQNGDGEISPDEIRKTLESFGMKRTL